MARRDSKGSIDSMSEVTKGSLLKQFSSRHFGNLVKAQHFSRRSMIRGTPRAFLLNDGILIRAACVALPCGAAGSLVRLAYEADAAGERGLGEVDTAFTAFSFLVMFLVVFRTSQSYTRFWEGCTSCHRMKAEWFDACSALISFSRCSRASPEAVTQFQHVLIRLFSMMHGIALAEVEDQDRSEDDVVAMESIEAFHFELLDPEGLQDESVQRLMGCRLKPELLYQWLQCLIIENVDNGVLAAPAPLLTRAYQELANGNIAFHEALKISTIAFPLPYVQVCDWMLILHYVLLPVVVPLWVGHWGWAFAFCFIQIFILWALKFTASEIENPFGTDSNDLDRKHLQREMNRSLKLLVDPEYTALPKLNNGRTQSVLSSNSFLSFHHMIKRLDGSLSEQESERYDDGPDNAIEEAVRVGDTSGKEDQQAMATHDMAQPALMLRVQDSAGSACDVGQVALSHDNEAPWDMDCALEFVQRPAPSGDRVHRLAKLEGAEKTAPRRGLLPHDAPLRRIAGSELPGASLRTPHAEAPPSGDPLFER